MNEAFGKELGQLTKCNCVWAIRRYPLNVHDHSALHLKLLLYTPKVRFNFPDGSRRVRGFRFDDTVQHLYDFVYIHDSLSGPYVLHTTYPSACLDDMQASCTDAVGSSAEIMVVPINSDDEQD